MGYTSNLQKRVKLHNKGKGAKFTKGRKWKLIYKECHETKSKALSREYYLKKPSIKKYNKIYKFMKISILLPYKENFSPIYPGAVSLFVRDTVNISKYKNKITIYGNTNFKERFKLKYNNIPLSMFRLQVK